ncbi:MAG: hypothetical protein ACOYEG_10090, partial [Petrimonas sp.]
AGSFASATPPLHCPLFIVISIIMNKFATKKDRNYTLFGTLPEKLGNLKKLGFGFKIIIKHNNYYRKNISFFSGIIYLAS